MSEPEIKPLSDYVLDPAIERVVQALLNDYWGDEGSVNSSKVQAVRWLRDQGFGSKSLAHDVRAVDIALTRRSFGRSTPDLTDL